MTTLATQNLETANQAGGLQAWAEVEGLHICCDFLPEDQCTMVFEDGSSLCYDEQGSKWTEIGSFDWVDWASNRGWSDDRVREFRSLYLAEVV